MFLLRRRRRSLGRLALFAFLCGWMLPFYEAHPLGLADDAACQIAPAGGGTSPAKLAAAVAGDQQSSHCYVCHLMRAMRGAAASDVARLVAPFEPSTRPSLAESSPFAAVLAAPSSRGPPAYLSI